MLKLASVLVLVLLQLLQQSSIVVVLGFTRDDFPSEFIFGSGTSAYQVEGATFIDGRTPSTLDTYAYDGRSGGYTGDVACDEYHKYKEDVQLMVDTGLDAYRLSISWSRLIPNGSGLVNPKGLEYYNNLINELINNGIQPHVTLVHFDHPQALQDAYGGWGNRQIVKDFVAYAEVCFREFGDRVLHWITINEPNILAHYTYHGSKTTLPYSAGHNLLLAHASVVKLYRTKFQATQHGFVGLTLYTSWYVPETNLERDLIAYERVNDFVNGWFMHPLVFGDYSNRMKQYLGAELPSFTENEAKLVKGSFDFIGLNCYNSTSVKDDPASKDPFCVAANCTHNEVGGEFVQGVLEYFKQVYGNPPMYIHENGFMTLHNASLDDTSRIHYLNASIASLLDATRNGSNVRGYFQWSIFDLFEMFGGYEYGFGLYYVDFNSSDLKRYPKTSAHWYSTFLKGEGRTQNQIIQLINNSTFNLDTNR